jgi:type III restriction enzyme
MRFQFKVQPYQSDAVNAVVDCFEGQPKSNPLRYRLDPGRQSGTLELEEGFRNEDIKLTDAALLENIQKVQTRQNLTRSRSLKDFTTVDSQGGLKAAPASYKPGAHVNLDVEMETGTGKTYCYIKTMFEMYERYGWSKFVVMVPSIAIREGVYKSFQMTADHFAETYGRKARFFIYNSKRLHEIESFSSDAGINVMIINIQAFNAKGADNRRIYDELDDFQSRRPIDVIKANRPVVILDEPQKMQGDATLRALPEFNPLMILRYSATHRTQHNRVYRLDALDAYNQKLVKKIQVRGIQTRGLAGTNAYLYLESIEISTKAPIARVEMEVKRKSGEIKRELRRVEFGDDLYELSNELDQYRDFTVSQIDANQDTVEFTNGVVLNAGEATGDVNERDVRRIQIRESIKAHLDQEKKLFAQGIKVLSLFFIDEVAKYRDYSEEDEKGEYARVFEREYARLVEEYLSELEIDHEAHRKYLKDIDAEKTHNGYFSIDKKSRMVDPKVKKTGEEKGLSDDETAYDLIMRDKERLLSFDEPTRFIFSHSALREGWDNPNVFVMCMLKHSDSTISRRQEVGRGLRIAVNNQGERMDHPSLVHDINVLTVVASESYKDFVKGLQTEIVESLSARPRKANKDFFEGKVLQTREGKVEVSSQWATRIYQYLLKHDYIDENEEITDKYHQDKDAGQLPGLHEELEPYREQIIELVDSVFDDTKLPKIDDGRKPKTNPLNSNFKKKEFQELWQRINRKAVYRVDFDSDELVEKAVSKLDSELKVTPLQYKVEVGEQATGITDEELRKGEGFAVTGSRTEDGGPVSSDVTYDLLGKIGEEVQLTRRTVAEILTGIQPAVFDQFKKNPEQFIAEASRIIKEQKASAVVEQLQYDEVEDRYDTEIFTAAQTGQDFSRATKKLNKHVYDYCIVDSGNEREFVSDLDTSDEIIVYAKLPRGFLIPTPVGDYNPDWAISLKRENVKYVYFMAETKGSMSSIKLREVEQKKIECARKFFEELNKQIGQNKVKYDVVTDYDKLMQLVS